MSDYEKYKKVVNDFYEEVDDECHYRKCCPMSDKGQELETEMLELEKGMSTWQKFKAGRL